MSLDRTTFAKRYAKALFDLLDSKDQLDDAYSELEAIRDIFNKNPALGSILSNHNFPEDKKKDLLQPLVDNSGNQLVKNFLKVVYEIGRMNQITDVIDFFEQDYDKSKKIVHADLISAVKLSSDEINRLKDAFAKRLDANEIIFNSTVDPSIIGGLIIKSSNVIIDGSVKSKIQQVKDLLLS